MTAIARRQQYKAELKTQILAAAREIFVRDGYESFSMRKLAQRIGYSPGSIYLHFKNKEQLFESLVDESFARLLKVLRKLQNGHAQEDPVAALKKGLRAYIEFGLRNPNDYRFAFLLRRPLVRRPYKVHPAFDVMRYMVRRCIEEKRFRPVDVETTSQVLWAASHGITSLLIQRPTFPWVAKRELIRQAINNAVDGLMARPDEEEAATLGVRHVQPSHV
ncbi:MAG TPA: TetR/AcrR family transcriptional regulator [Terriglobales bacterium]|jgi:AcrR family transcriptional regulator|nr:TetR/AcrR family transcriptional regulator [Terriglobales bacterium]